MPEEPERPTPQGASDDSALEAVLVAARRVLARGDGWDSEQHHYDRLRADCEKLGIHGNYQSITIALRDAFYEITAAELRRKADSSYAGLSSGQTLYTCRWESRRFSRTMYVKFALTDGGLEIFTFHAST